MYGIRHFLEKYFTKQVFFLVRVYSQPIYVFWQQVIKVSIQMVNFLIYQTSFFCFDGAYVFILLYRSRHIPTHHRIYPMKNTDKSVMNQPTNRESRGIPFGKTASWHFNNNKNTLLQLHIFVDLEWCYFFYPTENTVI